MDSKEVSTILKAMGDETRLNIVYMLKECELCACSILESFRITQPTLSYHMKILTDSGIIISKKRGTWTYYSINKEKLDLVKNFFDRI